MSDLSIIREVIPEQRPKDLNETMERSGDSGLASSESSNSHSGKDNTLGVSECFIIQFQALNASENNVRESTFVTTGGMGQEKCNLSGINASNAAQTINSSDGKS